MTTFMVAIFIIGYLAIAFEHPIKINKTASAILTGVFCWTIYSLFSSDTELIVEDLSHHLSKIAEILFFLLGAMTIVELVDVHEGFKVITDKITTQNSRKLLWIIALITFFLSALLDNLTTAIVMVSLLRKLVRDSNQRMLYASVVIITANAGGAWSPIGDVTTTMLWIGKQITATSIMQGVFIPSLLSIIVPVLYFSFKLKGDIKTLDEDSAENHSFVNRKASNIMFWVGVGVLVFVPIFKTITHLPPYMGILLGLGIIWVVSELINSHKDEEERQPLSVAHALSRIDASSVLFFLGILIAISSLESTKVLHHLATWMSNEIGNLDIISIFIGIASSIIDNVPLVAATQGMYDLSEYPTDSKLWEFLAYCAGTGGSILIIGSAAGVAVMGMEKIDFMWYLKKISLITLIGYLIGCAVYLLQYSIFH